MNRLNKLEELAAELLEEHQALDCSCSLCESADFLIRATRGMLEIIVASKHTDLLNHLAYNMQGYFRAAYEHLYDDNNDDTIH